MMTFHEHSLGVGSVTYLLVIYFKSSLPVGGWLEAVNCGGRCARPNPRLGVIWPRTSKGWRMKFDVRANFELTQREYNELGEMVNGYARLAHFFHNLHLRGTGCNCCRSSVGRLIGWAIPINRHHSARRATFCPTKTPF